MKNKVKNLLKSIILKKYYSPRKIGINNKEFLLPRFDEIGYPNLTINELWLIDLIENHLDYKDGVFIDIGANTGQTLLKLKSVDNDMFYLGIEPNNTCIVYLEKLVRVNSFKNVKLIPVGVSRDNKLLTLHSYIGDLDSCATVVEGYRERKVVKKTSVAVLKMETILNSINIENIAIVKIDVEGSELEVIQSLKKIIGVHKPNIILEVLPNYGKRDLRWKRQQELEKIISEMNYSIYRIIKSKTEILELKGIKDLGEHHNLNHCDYLLTPNNSVAS